MWDYLVYLSCWWNLFEVLCNKCVICLQVLFQNMIQLNTIQTVRDLLKKIFTIHNIISPQKQGVCSSFYCSSNAVRGTFSMGCWEVIPCGPAEAQSGWYFRNEVEVLLVLILLTGAIWPEVHSSNWWIFSPYISKDRIHVSPDCCCILSLRLWHWAKCPLFTLGVIHSSMKS